MTLSNEEKEILIQLICEKQTAMIIENHGSFLKEYYVNLEKLKIKLKEKGEKHEIC